MKKIFLLLSTIITSSCSVLGINTGETLNYKTISKSNEFEIREYSSYIVAQIELVNSNTDQSSDAFKILAGYIFGNKKSKNDISMTSPVIEQKSQKISMTSPVNELNIDGRYIMQFVMPTKYNLQNLPRPNNDNISLKKVESKTVAVIGYTWINSKSKKMLNEQKLIKWLQENKKYSVAGEVYYASYNPPWTIPFLRTNEVLVPIRINNNRE